MILGHSERVCKPLHIICLQGKGDVSWNKKDGSIDITMFCWHGLAGVKLLSGAASYLTGSLKQDFIQSISAFES